MSRRSVISDDARYDLDEITYYLALGSSRAAQRFADSFSATLETLQQSPEIGEKS